MPQVIQRSFRSIGCRKTGTKSISMKAHMETVRVLCDDKQTTDAMENVTSLSFRSGICSWREISDQSESEGN